MKEFIYDEKYYSAVITRMTKQKKGKFNQSHKSRMQSHTIK